MLGYDHKIFETQSHKNEKFHFYTLEQKYVLNQKIRLVSENL